MSGEPTLEKGVSGEWVGYLQQMMRDAGFWDRDTDGTFGDDLEQAVQALQDDLGLSPTGVVDADTWSALEQRVPQDQGGRPADPGSGDTARQESASSGYDPDAWSTFLAENGPRWNGDDAAWDQFRTWFVYQADQQGLADPANGFLTYVEGQPDKIAAFAAYGVTIAAPAHAGDTATSDTATSDTATSDTATSDASQAPDTSTFPETRPGDSGEWVAYLDAMLTSNGF